MTEAPPVELIPSGNPADDDQIESAVAAFRRQMDGQVSVSATVVQDGLLEIWGALPDGTARVEVERWLTETLNRHLYSVSDIDSRLDTVLEGQA